jgi:MoaA/NifB/PqqE/SkfB family radical SAM enzyme
MLSSLILELKTAIPCPTGCVHCTHRAAYVDPQAERWLDRAAAMALIADAAQLGIATVCAYPREGDVSLESELYAALFSRAHALGLKTKTTSAAITPDGLRDLLPHLDQLTLSIDGLNAPTYTRFRPGWLLPSLAEFLAWLDQERPERCSLAANVVVSKSFIGSGEAARLMETLADLKLFAKVNLLELLPGPDNDFQAERLGRSELHELLALKQRFKPRLKITVPAWKAGESGSPSCPLGREIMVIGPDGSVGACVLLLYAGLRETNIFRESSLAAACEKVQVYAQPAARERLYTAEGVHSRPAEVESCRPCRLYQEQRCAGGCVSRARLFGAEFERLRHCGGPWL